MNFAAISMIEGGRPAPLPKDEPQRLAYVRECGILDTPDEASFDRLTRLTARLTGAPLAGISVIDDHRQWIKSRFGPLDRESPRQISFCSYALLSNDPFTVPDALQDERFRTNPLVLGPPYIRFYAGVPLVSSIGYRLGALFIVDTEAGELSPADTDTLTDLAALATDMIENRSKWLPLG